MDNPTQYQPDEVTPTGDTLRESLETLGMSQSDFASRTGLSGTLVNQILEGTASITSETAIAIEDATGIPAEFWLNRDSRYQAFLARSSQPNHFADIGKMVAPSESQ